MASENLVIDVNEGHVQIKGSFVFRSASHLKKHRPNLAVKLMIPIWIPSSAGASQADLQSFMDTFRMNDDNKVTETNKAIFSETVDFSIKLEGEDLSSDNFMILNYECFEKSPFLNTNYMSPDVCELRFGQVFSPSVMTNDAHITISYKQPIIQKDGKELIYYVPFFEKMEEGYLDSNPDLFHITFHCPNNYELIPVSEQKYHSTPSSSKIDILPEHEKPILVELKKKS